MPIVERSGSIFTSDAQVLVNTVNCAGVMGAGLALEMRYRYPEMYRRYVERCEANLVKIGSLDLETSTTPWVLNFPTKKHWRFPSRPEYLKSGLATFRESWQSLGIRSIAFPLLGASHGGLDPEVSRSLMVEALQDLPLTIEIWTYDSDMVDDLVPSLRAHFSASSDRDLAKEIGLTVPATARLRDALGHVSQANQLTGFKGLGEVTLERIFQYAMSMRHLGPPSVQTELPLDV